jgi:cellulose synthase/poly-beta-1,6-N-acetylglucosamine synthase-like glycosyltransferase
MYVSNADAKYLREALESVYAQTVPLEQLVIVIASGGLTAEQECIIADYQSDLRIPSIEIIGPVADATTGLNAGLSLCTGNWVMRMDGDTINHPDRLAILLDYVDRHPNVRMFGSWCEEFCIEKRRTRASAINHTAIIQTLRWRNVLVHPSTLIHTATLKGIGGYRNDFASLADYDLHVRLVMAGAILRVIPAALISMPVRSRRGGLGAMVNEVRFRVFCWRIGFLSKRQFFITTLCQSLFDVMGVAARNKLYRLVRLRAIPTEVVQTTYAVVRPSEVRSNVY